MTSAELEVALQLAEALAGAVGAAYKTYEASKSGEITPTQAIDALTAMTNSLAQNNATVDVAVDEKFPK